MRAHFRKTGDCLCKFLCDDSRLQRPQTNPFDPFHFMNRKNQRQKAFSCIDPVRAQMDSGKNHFLITICRQRLHFLYNTFQRTASHTASRIRNNTIGTELITSILHLQICPRMFRSLIQRKLLIFLGLIDINDFSFQLRIIRFQNLYNIMLPVISHNDINTLVHLLLLRLDITSCCHNNGIGIHLSRPVEHLP